MTLSSGNGFVLRRTGEHRKRYRSAAIIAAFGLISAVTCAVPSTATAADLTFAASADAMVSEAYPMKSYGSEPTLAVGADPKELSYLRFDVKDVPDGIKQATLRLYAEDGSSDGPDLVEVRSKWNESRITGNMQPKLRDTVLGDLDVVASAAWVEFDLTDLITNVGTYSFALRGAAGDRSVFSSREGRHPPELLIRTEAPSTDVTTSPTTDTEPTAPTDGGSSTPTTSVSIGIAALPADAFVESIGVNAHLSWGGTIWDTQFEKYKPMMGELGVRYVRTVANSVSRAKLLSLYSSFGIKSVFLMNFKTNGVLDASKAIRNIAYIRDNIGVDKAIAIEGANEYNSNRGTNPNWPQELRDFQKAIFNTLKSDPVMAGLFVVGPSIWKRIYQDFVALGSVDDFADIANLHYYTGGRKPTVWAESGVEYPMDTALWYATILVPTSPAVWVTETGYNNIADTVDSPFAVPEPTAAKYSLRMLAEFFRRGGGEGKSFIYSFLDDPEVPTNEYGLLRKDLSKKPAYYGIRNIIRLLSDSGSKFSPGYLNLAIAGDKSLVNHVVLQKRDGRFYLLIWLDAESYNRKTAQESFIQPRALSIDVSAHKFVRMNLYLPTAIGMADPEMGVSPVRSVLAPTVVNIEVPDQVLVVEMIP